ncbi:MAG: prevent-host-death protein [Deltaproteobacteria bacterium]|nr:prevent-host-death protein [Deltaproteobacteria bacterium]
MKSSTLPPLRVEPGLRQAAERLLRKGETLSSFVEESVRESIERRTAQEDFIARGLASAEAARKSGKYVSAAAVLAKLEQQLAPVRKSAKAARGRRANG